MLALPAPCPPLYVAADGATLDSIGDDEAFAAGAIRIISPDWFDLACYPWLAGVEVSSNRLRGTMAVKVGNHPIVGSVRIKEVSALTSDDLEKALRFAVEHIRREHLCLSI